MSSEFDHFLSAYKQDQVHNLFTEDRFPLVDDGTGDKPVIEYHHGGYYYDIEYVLRLMKNDGFRPVGLKKAMAYLIANPEAQRENSLVVLGSVYDGGFGRYVPVFVRGIRCRIFLDLYSPDASFPSHFRFLSVCDLPEPGQPKYSIEEVGCRFLNNELTVVENRRSSLTEWDPSKVDFYLSSEQRDNKRTKGDELFKKMRGLPVLDGNILDWLMLHPHFIPWTWAAKKRIFFWGTIYKSSLGHLLVRCLVWGGYKWVDSLYQLDNYWGGNDPAAILASE